MANNAAFDLFVERAHQLMQAGYGMMDAEACNLWAEPEISGELGSKIEDLLCARRQSWMRYWTAVDNWPENEPDNLGRTKRLGKRRPTLNSNMQGSEKRCISGLRRKSLQELETTPISSATRMVWDVFSAERMVATIKRADCSDTSRPNCPKLMRNVSGLPSQRIPRNIR